MSSSIDWYKKYEYTVTERFADFLHAEHFATHVRALTKHVIPGQLQTRDYAREVLREYHGATYMYGNALEIRMERQKRLNARTEIKSEFIVTQTALRRPFGDYKTWRDQLLAIRSCPTLYVASREQAKRFYDIDSYVMMTIPDSQSPDGALRCWFEGFAMEYNMDNCEKIRTVFDEVVAEIRTSNAADVIDQILEETSEY